MSTDPKKHLGDGSEHRPSGSEGKDGRRGESGGHRSKAGSDYGDWVPDRGQPQRNDDIDSDPIMGDFATGHEDMTHLPKRPGSPRPRSDEGQSGDLRTGVPGEPEKPSADESNRNKDFDTPHVHSSTTPRKV